MNRRRLAVLGGTLLVAACVEIAAGPGGVTAIRLAPVPPSVIVGDQLRDSTGAVVRLRAVAFDADGDTVPDAAFRFTALPLPRDTTAAEQRAPVTVDSLTGAVTASGTTTPLASRARLVARLGDRLQFIDTIAVVKRPTRLERAATNGDSLHVLAVPCNDSGTVNVGTRFPVAPGDTSLFGNAIPLAVRLTADSVDTLRAAVPSYYVRFDIVSPTSIPTATVVSGARRPAIAITRDVANDTPTNTDTTESTGTASALLRVVPNGIGRLFVNDTASVLVRATARTTPTTLVRDSVRFVVRLRRIRGLPGQAAFSGPGCS